MPSFSVLSLVSALVHGGYIVTLKSTSRGDVTEPHLDNVRALFGEQPSATNKIQHVYGAALKGYSAEFSDDVLAQVKAMPEVEAVEADQKGYGAAVQPNAPWGLARITSQSRLPDNSSLWSYNYEPSAGSGVDVFVVDSGIAIDHPDFQGRALWGANFVNAVNVDEHGHGSHVAGTVGSATFGVAKNATLIAVKVLDADNLGFVSYFIAGINWSVQHKKAGRGCVLNLSLAAGRSDAFNLAVRNAVDAGCVVVVAAGNKKANACSYSPSSEPSAITVGATNIQDSRASFSNWGQCLDVFAPGENILSVSNKGGSKLSSGTSMASPHVAGLAAHLMSETQNYNATSITQTILDLSQSDILTNVGTDSPNLLISNNVIV